MIIKQIKKVIPILLIILLCMVFPLNKNKVIAAPVRQDDLENSSGAENANEVVENARERLATFAENFANSKGNSCIYTLNFSARAATYQISPQSSGPFKFDCVGWVNYAIHWALDFEFGLASSGNGGFVTNSGVKDTVHFAQVFPKNGDNGLSNIARRGDILIFDRGNGSGHVAIYLGGQTIVDCIESTPAVRVRTMANWKPSWMERPFQSVGTLVSTDGKNYGELPGGIDITDIPEGTLTAAEVDLDEIIDRMEFDGMPPDVSYDGGHSLMYYIDKVTEAFDYLIGIMFNGIKVTIVAVIDGVQSIITSALEFLSGTNTT